MQVALSESIDRASPLILCIWIMDSKFSGLGLALAVVCRGDRSMVEKHKQLADGVVVMVHFVKQGSPQYLHAALLLLCCAFMFPKG